MKKRVISLATVLAFALCGCGNNRTPEEAVTNFYQASMENDIQKALENTNVDKAERDQVAEIVNMTGMEVLDYELLGSTIDEGDTTATVEMRLTVTNTNTTDTATTNVSVPCIKSNGTWSVKFL